jgi:hypothetical protein
MTTATGGKMEDVLMNPKNTAYNLKKDSIPFLNVKFVLCGTPVSGNSF